MEDTPYFVQYIMATIKVPMIRQPSGKIDSLSDHTTIDFETIRGLPVKPDYKVDNAYIKKKINELLRSAKGRTVEDSPGPLTNETPSLNNEDNSNGLGEEPVQEPVQEPVDEPVEEPVDEPVEEPVDEPVQEPVQEPVEEEIVPEEIIDVNLHEEPVEESDEDSIDISIDEEPSDQEKSRIMEVIAAERLRSLGAKFLLNDKKKSSSKKVMKERSPSPEFSMRK
jgi:hypothetical protein